MSKAVDQEILELHITNGCVHTYGTIMDDYSIRDLPADTRKKAEYQIDRTLQKLRKKGLIACFRKGRIQYWQAITPERVA